MNSDVFGGIWIVVPFISADCNDIPSFLNKHKWFCDGGGRILFKAAGVIDNAVLTIIEAAGCQVAQVEDSGIYDAWNQAMDIIQSSLFDDDSYVAFMGLDDVINESFCLAVAHHSNKPRKPDFIFGDSKHVLDGRCKYRISPSFPKLFGKGPYVFDVPHPGLMNRWGATKSFRFDFSYKMAADFDFYIGIANAGDVSYKKIDELQVVIGANGMSNSIKALKIYLHEWAMIASRRHVVLAVPRFKIALFQAIATIPSLFNALRRISWIVRAKKI